MPPLRRYLYCVCIKSGFRAEKATLTLRWQCQQKKRHKFQYLMRISSFKLETHEPLRGVPACLIAPPWRKNAVVNKPCHSHREGRGHHSSDPFCFLVKCPSQFEIVRETGDPSQLGYCENSILIWVQDAASAARASCCDSLRRMIPTSAIEQKVRRVGRICIANVPGFRRRVG
jgi:hypothetical protein